MGERLEEAVAQEYPKLRQGLRRHFHRHRIFGYHQSSDWHRSKYSQG